MNPKGYNFVAFRFGRCESLEDMWIAGNFTKEQIRCSSFARDEVERLSLKANATRDALFFATTTQGYFYDSCNLFIYMLSFCRMRRFQIRS